MNLENLIINHLSDINSYNPRDLTKNDKTPKYIQTASNCWIYAMCNNLYFNTGIDVNPIDVEQLANSIGKNSQVGGKPKLSTILICELLKDKNIHGYSIDFRNKVRGKYIDKEIYTDKDLNKTKIRLFTKLLLKGYVFEYSRIHGKDLTNDVREDDDIDKPLSLDNVGGRHATNIAFIDKKFRELGSWGDTSRYNEFERANTDYFIQSIKNGTIRPVVYFIDYKNG